MFVAFLLPRACPADATHDTQHPEQEGKSENRPSTSNGTVAAVLAIVRAGCFDMRISVQMSEPARGLGLLDEGVNVS
jgi:hypothetical protein